MRYDRFLAMLLVGSTACETQKIPTAPGLDAVEVSAVLNPSLSDQTVLVERIHSGRVAIDTVPFDPADPIATGRGIPISGARVVVSDAARGDSVVLEEDLATRGVGPGVYRFSNPDLAGGTSARVLRVVPGAHYLLRVTTPDGTTVEGETTVPDTRAVAVPSAVVDTFDRSSARLALSWPRVGGTTEYALMVESPLAPFMLVTPDTSVVLDGSLRQPWNGLTLVFTPGFRQAVTVLAMDVNFYDFYRPERSSSASSRSHLRGGYGLFGSVVPLLARTLAVTLPPSSPPAGRWSLIAGDSVANAPKFLELYVSDRQGSGVTVTGNYSAGLTTPLRGVLGQQLGDSVSLALLGRWSAVDTLNRLDGVLRDSTLELVDRMTKARVRYVYGR